jgi:hypothetical protein
MVTQLRQAEPSLTHVGPTDVAQVESSFKLRLKRSLTLLTNHLARFIIQHQLVLIGLHPMMQMLSYIYEQLSYAERETCC